MADDAASVVLPFNWPHEQKALAEKIERALNEHDRVKPYPIYWKEAAQVAARVALSQRGPVVDPEPYQSVHRATLAHEIASRDAEIAKLRKVEKAARAALPPVERYVDLHGPLVSDLRLKMMQALDVLRSALASHKADGGSNG